MTTARPEPPDGWLPVPPEALETALAVIHRPLEPAVAVPRLTEYYRSDGNYAGATFVEVSPVDAGQFTAADLFAITLLSVDAPGPRVARQILDPGATRSQLVGLLCSPELAGEVDLAETDNAELHAMEALYAAVKRTLGSNPWVTAGKLCARKRPRLFPVRDALVCAALGLSRYRSYQIDWQVYRAAMRDPQILAALHAVHDQAAATPQVHPDPVPLRWLDVVLWMQAKDAATRS